MGREGLTPDIAKLPVLKHQKFPPPRHLVQPTDSLLAKIADDIGMSLEDADVFAHLLSDPQQLVRRSDVGGETQVRPLGVHEAQEICRHSTVRQI